MPTKSLIDVASPAELEAFKIWLDIPLEVAASSYFHPSNADAWVVLDKFTEFLKSTNNLWKKYQQRVKAGGKPTTASPAEIIEISSGSEADDAPVRPARPYGVKKRAHSPELVVTPAVKRRQVKVEPNSDSEVEILETRSRGASYSVPPGHDTELRVGGTLVLRDDDGRYTITQKLRVDDVQVFQTIPRRWPVPATDTAYIVDFNSNKMVAGKALAVKEGKGPKGLDRFLKEDDQDSWGKGSNGSTTEDTKIRCLGKLSVRRSAHVCNGTLSCSFFDESTLENYVRVDGEDMTVMQTIFEKEQQQYVADNRTSLAGTETFFRYISDSPCEKEGCRGKPALRHLKKGPSVTGKNHFIGCAGWQAADHERHRYIPIPRQVDEAILFKFMNKMPVTNTETDLGEYAYDGKCYTLLHPRHGKQKHCKHTHIRNGLSAEGKIIKRPCSAKKIVYTSKDPLNLFAIVTFKGKHDHPPWPAEKPTNDAKDDVAKCVTAGGVFGVTAGRIDNASSTVSTLGMKLSDKHPSLRNHRKLQDLVKLNKDKTVPAGTQWKGVVDLFEREQGLSQDKEAKCYLWHLRMEGDIRLVVTAHPYLAKLVHSTAYLVCDFTFKRVRGDLNEWEVAMWHAETSERVTAARIYCNKATAEAFEYIFEGLFKAIEHATGHPVKFKVFDKTGNLLGVLLDMEAAQVQGLGRAIQRLGMNKPEVSGIYESDPELLVQYVLKLCKVHLERAVEKLKPIIGREQTTYLLSICILEDVVDIEKWHKWCKVHPSKEVKDWYAHKVTYSWLLPGFNETLSPMPTTFWKILPSHTNLVETAHVESNRNTGISLSPLEAIESTRKSDAAKAASIQEASKSCIPRRRDNSELNRLSRNVSRTRHRADQRESHLGLDTEIETLKAKVGQATGSNKKELRALLKDCEDRKRALGRSPRHNRITSGNFDDIEIPRIRGLTLCLTPIPEVSPASPEMTSTHTTASPPPNEILAPVDIFLAPCYDSASPMLATPPFLVESNCGATRRFLVETDGMLRRELEGPGLPMEGGGGGHSGDGAGGDEDGLDETTRYGIDLIDAMDWELFGQQLAAIQPINGEGNN